MERFAIRDAVPADARGIASTHVMSWKTSYRGILPDDILDRLDVGQRLGSRQRILADPKILTVVAYDTSHGDIVGFCDAGPRRGDAPGEAEIYAIYIEHHAKRYGLGRLMFERVQEWRAARNYKSLSLWVLENNPAARRFYEAMGGRAAQTMGSRVAGFAVTEVLYMFEY